MSRRLRFIAPIAAALAALLGGSIALAAAAAYAGPQGNGTGITPNGWVVSPAGRQIDLADKTWWSDRPFGEALSPDGRTLLVTSNGQSMQTLKVVDVPAGTVRQTIPYKAPEALFIGLTWSPDGKHAYASAGGNNKVRRYDWDGSTLTEQKPIPVSADPAGLTVSADGRTLYAAQNLGDSLAVIDLATATLTSVALGACGESGGPVQYATSGQPAPAQCQPYGAALSRDGRTVFASNWGEHSVTAIDAATRAVRGKINVGTHPNAMAANPQPSRPELYVANGDSDSISVINTNSLVVTRTYSLAPYRGAAIGSNPDALTVSPDGRTLYVSNAGNDDVAVISLASSEGEDEARSVRGLIPTAWYPSGVAISPDGRRLYVTNTKGLGAGPNPGYQQGQFGPPDQYVGSMIHGTLSIIDVPDGEALRGYTSRVARLNASARGQNGDEQGNGGDGAAIPRHPGDASPIKHVIYIIKENRTYDQVFGSLGKGNGDPALNLFGDESATNIRALARKFVTLDNFYASAEVSADGWNWSTAANANGYVQRTWPANYSDVNRGRGYDFEGGNYATAPNSNVHDAYLWDRLAAAQVSFRNYGFFTVFGSMPAVAQPTAPNLAARTAPGFPGYNLSIADSPCGSSTLRRPSRFTDWESEFNQYVANNNLPSFEFLRLPNDHTRGTAGPVTPRQYVADNDYAVGRVVQSVSRSKYWASTAIFLVEDDAQDGPDHVDAHRTEALVISPYTQTGKVDSTFYSTVSMLRTMELITGLKPMSQFDAAATPMLKSFSRKANVAAYTATVPPVLRPTAADPGCPVLSATTASSEPGLSGPGAPLATESAAMDFATADAPDNQVLNQAIWKSIKGSDSQMPAPVYMTGEPAPAPNGRDPDG